MTPSSSISRFLALLVPIAFSALAQDDPAPAPPVFDETAYRQEISDWQAGRQTGLSNPDGWRALVGLDWLEPGATTVGGAPDNRIVLPTDNAPPHLGTFTVGDKVRFRPAEDAEITVDGQRIHGEIAIATDMEEGSTVLEAGSLTIQVIAREEKGGTRLALRSRDREHPRLAHPPQLAFYPIDPTWRFEARFEPYDPPRQIPIVNVLGMSADEPVPGALVFARDGSRYRLDALAGGDELFVIFGDQTNCHGTYCSGRYLYTEAPREDGTVTLDFNRAYDPPCAFTDFATCPLPPKQNKLPLAVTAGERYDASYGGHG